MNFSRVHVLCIGDVMLDRFVYGDMERISPEAPVPVVRLRETREMLGGAGNVVSNILSLGGRATLVGLVGDDQAAATIHARLEHERVTSALVTTAERPTICKTRYIATHQQVVRIDEESRTPLTPPEESALRARFMAHIEGVQAVVVSDYGKGVCSPPLLKDIMAQARARGIAVFVDPKHPDFSLYAGASCITPNQKELAAAASLRVESDEQTEQAARKVMQQSAAGAVLVTRSEKGMMLVLRSGPAHAVPARAREVFDVSGAGDTVIATLALAHGSGMELAQAMHIANAAAGVVVGKLGTATADIQEVLAELDPQPHGAAAPGCAPLQEEKDARGTVELWRAQGLRVGFTNGCFDILHPGHLKLLSEARKACDRLVVGLNTDDSIRRLKGKSRPVNPLEVRARMLAALRYVDLVVPFAHDTPLELVTSLRPDLLVKGADYAPEQVVGAAEVIKAGGRLLLVDLAGGHSTTGVIEQIRQKP